MQDLNITSGAQYAKILTDVLREVEQELKLEDRMDDKLFELWCEEVSVMAKESFVQYIIGNKEDYHLTDSEMNYCLEVAGIEYTTYLLNGLVDKGFVDKIENDNGDDLYKLSEEGKTYIQTINN